MAPTPSASHALGITLRFNPNAIDHLNNPQPPPASFSDQYFYDWTSGQALNESPTDASEVIPPADLSQQFSIVLQPNDGSYSQLTFGTVTVTSWQKTGPGGTMNPDASVKCPFDPGQGALTDNKDGTVSFWNNLVFNGETKCLTLRVNWNQSELTPNQVFGFTISATLNGPYASGLVYTSDPEVEIGPDVT